MANTQKSVTYADIDIDAAIHHAITEYAPLMHDRHRVEISVMAGVVHVSGYVKSAPTYKYVKNSIKNVKGVKDVVFEEFYNDEDLRLEVAKVIPHGTYVNMEYGAVILSGSLPEGEEVEPLVRKVGLIPGVHRVLTSFNG